jgi:hypothetical protein
MELEIVLPDADLDEPAALQSLVEGMIGWDLVHDADRTVERSLPPPLAN